MLISTPWPRALLSAAFLCLSVSAARAVDARLFPADTEIVVTINFKQALAPPESLPHAVKNVPGSLVRQGILNKLKKAFVENLAAKKVLDKIGFDPLKDLHSATVALADFRGIDLIMVVEGRFAQDKFEAAAKELAASGQLRLFKAGKVSVCQLTNQGTLLGDIVWFTIVEGRSLIMCNKEEAFKEALARVEKNQFVARKVENPLKRINDKQTLSFAIAREIIGGDGEMFGFSADFTKNGVCGSATLLGDIVLELHFEGQDETTAKKLVAVGNNNVIPRLRKMAAQGARNNEPLTPLVDLAATLRMERIGTHAILSGSISYLNVARLFADIAR